MIYLVWKFKYKSWGTKRLIFTPKIFRIDAIFAMKIQIEKKINVSFSVKIQIKVNNKVVWIFAGSQKCQQSSKVNCEFHSSLNWNKFWIKNSIWNFRTFQFKLLLFSQLLSLNRLSNRVTLTKIKVFILFSAILANFWLFTRHQEKTRETLRNSSWKKKENVFCCEKLLKNNIFGK